MMTTTEILKEIYRLPIDQQNDIKNKIMEDSERKPQQEEQMTQAEFDQILFEDGVLANLPIETLDDDDDYLPVEFSGKPISETIIEERR